jgi:hypothetical protein
VWLPSCAPLSCRGILRRYSTGGAEGTRTPDIRLAKAALSQLSYGPVLELVGHSGLEPETSVLSGLRSNQLS